MSRAQSLGVQPTRPEKKSVLKNWCGKILSLVIAGG